MLLLVTIGLVLVGAVSLVIGFVSNSLGPIYLSIVCSVIAGVVLILFSRMAKRQAAPAAAGGEALGAAAPAPAPRPTPEAATEAVHVLPASGGDGEFPIADYDELRVNQILPLLGELEPDELAQVRRREAQGRNRGTIIARIDQAARSAAAQYEAEAPAAPAAPARVPAPPTADGAFPIADYDDLKVPEIVPLLDELDDDELELVAEREERGKNRAAIIGRIDAIFGEPAPAPAKRAAKKKAAARRAPARRVAAKRVVAKRAAPPKRAAVKRAAAKRAAPRKAAAKRPAKKAPAKRR